MTGLPIRGCLAIFVEIWVYLRAGERVKVAVHIVIFAFLDFRGFFGFSL